jgi:hypothetical protein
MRDLAVWPDYDSYQNWLSEHGLFLRPYCDWPDDYNLWYPPIRRRGPDGHLPPLGTDFNCAFCGVWYSAIWRCEALGELAEYFHTGRSRHERVWILGEMCVADGWKTYHRAGVFPVCSTSCHGKLYKRMKFYFQRRKKEWQAIRESRQLLRTTKKLLSRNLHNQPESQQRA